ncbi:tRNA pseudouridine(38-40) synthase TruA [Natronobiforma cellulositropha]|uniref:tRNA pseudouridine(38-40) synthase TruA n=1 Tax=Natronobiforma cellulositropha TaxID=1679076 RepID=UPI0021D5725E|nr:tRNA pseudouridine(38-40) synthase TruA [Natronobiforma cellulositropha]
MPRRAFRIAYDGTPFSGFQRQPDVRTVEGTIFDALGALEVFEGEKPPGYAAAGRTDAGVSALAQTVALDAPEWLTPRALNSRLPETVRSWAACDTPADFHATHHASERTYTYHLYAPPARVDDERAEAALEALSGRHDVHNLTPDDWNTDRTLELEATRDGAYLVLTARAGGFCRELVRRLVSLVEAVATGDTPLEKIDRVLAADPLPGHEGIAPAPPEPLVLTRVAYPDLSFETDPDALERARECFERQRIAHTTGARVARTIGTGLE